MGVAEELRERAQKVVDATGSALVRIGRNGGRGCGFVVGPGVVVTNAHNLRDRTTEVTFADGRAVQGRALGIDVDGDLAVLEVDTGEATPLDWAEGPAQLGEPVFAVARIPDGVRVTVGAVSAVGRTFRGPRGRRITDGIEHTAPLARGSSGSPIVDENGRLVGISTLRLGDGFSIALPAGSDLGDRINGLREGKGPQRLVLGVGLAPAHITRRLRRAVGLPDRDGVLVRMVEPGSPADRAGLQRGDLITKVGDTDVTSADQVAAAIDGVTPGGTLALHVARGTEELDLVVSFAEDGGGTTDHGEA
ncbi:MAG TPA: trypsin-like peptidase domain-containing protein [Acidimicrobiales bacterium]|jgi:S1-C subfamily serine protease